MKKLMTLCDIGNSTYHFYLSNGSQFKISINDELNQLNITEPIYFISVNELAKKQFLKTFPKSINLQNYLKFKSTYSSTLGLDRAIACFESSNSIIIDFGSAITVDVMKNDTHLGGFILPGFKKLQTIYPEISEKLIFQYQNNLPLNTLPKNTNQAITYAINSMIIEPIKKIQSNYNLNLLITGEDGKTFLQYFENASYEPNLIFNNMQKIITRNNI